VALKIIASERALLGLNQDGLAKMIGVSQATVSSWELGKSEPGSESIKKMSRIFGCSADYLLGLSANRQQMVLFRDEVPAGTHDEASFGGAVS
jgi:transcriptional regulator with XRE-family HTH domain